jgi:GNAT superfamily N-acetyltransferase
VSRAVPRQDAPVRMVAARSWINRRRFLTFPWRVYAGDPLWVPPLLPDRSRALRARRAAGGLQSFLALRGGRVVGTIAVTEDRANLASSVRDARFGWFECLPDPEAAGALLDHAAAWARERGLEHLAGPYNLDAEDSHGVLIEGRDRPPALLCGHAPPYYPEYLERCGFTPLYGDGLAFEVRLDQESPALQKCARLAERIRRRGWIRLRTPDLPAWEAEVDVVLDLLNRSLAHLPGHRPWQRETVEGLLRPFRKIADPELILFAEVEGRTVGWFPGLPNLNEAAIRLNGLRHPWDYLRLVRASRVRPRCLAVKSVLVLPEYWGSGAALLLFDEMARRARARGYEWIDLSLTSADNPYTPYLAERFGARLYKRYRVYQRPVSGVAGPAGRATAR